MNQLALELEPPITFVVRAVDGRILETFREDEMATWTGRSGAGKAWHEASCWAYLAIKADADRLSFLTSHTCQAAR